MNFTLLLPCSVHPPDHGNGSTPIDHHQANDAERIPQHRRILASDTAPDHTNWTKQIGSGSHTSGWDESGRCATTGKIAAGYSEHRGLLFERAPASASDSHSLRGLPQSPSTPAHRHGVGLPRHIDRQSSKAHHKVERRFSSLLLDFCLATEERLFPISALKSPVGKAFRRQKPTSVSQSGSCLKFLELLHNEQ